MRRSKFIESVKRKFPRSIFTKKLTHHREVEILHALRGLSMRELTVALNRGWDRGLWGTQRMRRGW